MTLAFILTLTSAYMQADFFGKVIFLFLFFLSIVCWFFLIYKIWLIKEIKKYSSAFERAVHHQKNEILNLSIEKLPKVHRKEIPHPFAHIFFLLKQKTIEVLEKNHFYLQELVNKPSSKVHLSTSDIELIDSCVQAVISKEQEHLDKNLFLLSTIVTLAPFVGLLGTVWGILVTFAGLQQSQSLSSNTAVLGGISTALATTALGLLIAIPALVSYNYLKNASRRFFAEMQDFSQLLLATIELQYRKVDIN